MLNLRHAFAFDSADSSKVRLEKYSILLLAGTCCFAGSIWAGMYYLIFGWSLTTFLPASFVVIVGSALIISHLTKNHYYAIYTQILCILYITAFIQWSIGTVFDSGLVLIWAFLAPICALMFFSIRQATAWLGLYIINIGITIAFNDFFVENGQSVSNDIQLLFFGMNLAFASIVVFIFSSYYVNSAVREREKAHELFEANLRQEMTLRETDKLATMGKLSAGVAHELNNPAAAVQRGAEHLRTAIGDLGQASIQTTKIDFPPEVRDLILQEQQLVEERAKHPLELDPLSRSDQEYEIETWLEQKNVPKAWEIAPMLVSIGYNCENLTKFTENLTGKQIAIFTSSLCNTYTTNALVEEIAQGAGQISEIVKALKSYSYLDQAPMQAVNLHEGLDDTLVMLRSKLKAGIQVHRDYAPDLPQIDAYGSELNQVWTNIIDNAVVAMNNQGEITLKTYRVDSWAVVEIKDNGPGIPANIQSKIFDPFFTTKALGEGTGLGLNISHNIIVQKHKGKISVQSKPGETCFQIRLPFHLSEAP